MTYTIEPALEHTTHAFKTRLKRKYRKTCVKRSLSKRPKIVFQDQLWLNTRGVQEIRGQMLPFPQFVTGGRETCT